MTWTRRNRARAAKRAAGTRKQDTPVRLVDVSARLLREARAPPLPSVSLTLTTRTD